jgi:hypothetical protein
MQAKRWASLSLWWGAWSVHLGGLLGLANATLICFPGLDEEFGAWDLSQAHVVAVLLCLLGMFGLYGALRLAWRPGAGHDVSPWRARGSLVWWSSTPWRWP